MLWSQRKKSVYLFHQKKVKTFKHFEIRSFICHGFGMYIFLNTGFIWEPSSQALGRPQSQNVGSFTDVQDKREQLHKQLHSVSQSVLLGFHLTSSGEQILLPSLTSDSNFTATKTHLIDWWKGTWPLAPRPQIKKKFLWIPEWAFLPILLQ